MTTLSYSVPVPGSELNSSADPKISTALQTILGWAAGGIDTGNLSTTAGITFGQLAAGAGRMSLVTKTLAYSANSGDLVIAGVTGAPFTVTLPAPSLNALVGVVAGASATGANPITVARHSVDVINGVGLSSATSFALGIPGAHALLQSDGTNWFVIAGQQDTGWVNLTLGSGMATHGSDTPAARLVGDRVTLRGAIDQSSGSASTLATVPAAMKPSGATFLPGAMFQSPNYFATWFTVNTSTGVMGSANSGTAPISFYFDDCSYTLS
jgi:hypothetical protein